MNNVKKLKEKYSTVRIYDTDDFFVLIEGDWYFVDTSDTDIMGNIDSNALILMTPENCEYDLITSAYVFGDELYSTAVFPV